MNVHSINENEKLAAIISSVGKDPSNWQSWFCLQIGLKNERDNLYFQKDITWIQSILKAYLNNVEGDVFFCRNQNLHIFCKNVSKGVLVQTGQQICDLLFEESALLAAYEIFDLEQDGFHYASSALKQGDTNYTVPISAYSTLDPLPKRAISFTEEPFTEKRAVNHKGLPKVLLIEDDPVTRWMVRKSLKYNCILETARTANQSFVRFQSLQPDVVFLDIDLPDKSGREVLNWIMRNDPGMCVVMFSANNDIKNIYETLQAGASGFIAKPFLREQLLHYIHKHSG